MTLGRVVIVEDSATISKFLYELVSESGYEVVGVAGNGIQGEALVREKRPGLVLSDIRMPGGDGIEMTERIMRESPVPVVLITAYDPTNPDLVFRALQAGALEVLPKPPSRKDPNFEKYIQQFRRTLRILYGMPVVRRFGSRISSGGIELPSGLRAVSPDTPAQWRTSEAPSSTTPELPIIAIGASTGGPTIVASLLQALDHGRFRYVVVAQHIVPDFLLSFCGWLQSMISHPVKMAEQGEAPQEGFIYLAPPSMHLVLDSNGCWKLMPPSAVASPHVPSIDVLFESLAPLKQSKVGILLTGMGQDGAAGLRLLKDASAITIVQDPGSAVVPSMPQTALRINAATFILRPSKIEAWLRSLKSD